MEHRNTPPPILAHPLGVRVVDGEIVLFALGVACSMTPDAARESAWLIIDAANTMQRH